MATDNFNPQQLEAVNSNERTILCLAGAGCGKTKTLIGRCERLVKDGVDPTSILCLTFTNAAAFEMKERFKRLPGLDVTRGVPEFRTFHGFCYSLIVKDSMVREALGYTKIPEICDDYRLKEVKSLVKQQIGCSLSMAKLEGKERLSRAEQEEKDIFNKALKKYFRKENLITFDIMCYNVGELFVRNDPCTFVYKQKYTHLMLDEFQDTDTKQMRFVSSFPETVNFFVCADALQCIYQFRNCTNEFVKQLSTAPGWKVIRLYKNYRSTRQICDYANNFSTYASDEYRIEMEGQRDGVQVKTIGGSMSTYQQPVDVDHLNQLIQMLKDNPVESAILCRTNKECACVKDALKEAGIECSASNKSTDALDILRSSLDNEYMLEWLSAKLEAVDYADYIRLATIEENADIRWFLKKYGSRQTIQGPAKKIIDIRKIIGDKSLTAQEQFNQITKLVRVKTKCKFDAETMTTSRKMITAIIERIEELTEAKVYCGTIHSSKGLEYEAVYVMGVNDKSFRLGDEEMNNLYYVAITRPKEYLTVFKR